jgi:hypothetical protein
MFMTVFEYDPQWTVENNGACCSVDKQSPWCLKLSECIYEYEGRFSRNEAMVKYCEWPLTVNQFNKSYWRHKRNNFRTYEEYIASSPKVEYTYYWDQGFYNLRNTDNTLTFAFQNDEYIFFIHITSLFENYYNDCGFGCVINKYNNDIHCTKLCEDDGNWWSDHDIDYDEMAAYEWSLVTAVVNDLPESIFNNKESLIEKLFTYGKRASKQK